MKTFQEIKRIVKAIPIPSEGFNFIEVETCLFGKNSNGEIAFGFATKNENIFPMKQSTRYLRLLINYEYVATINGKTENIRLSLLTLKEHDDKYVDVFIRLSISMIDNLVEDKLINSFFELKDIFSSEKRISETELQGMFGELFAMYYLKKRFDADISLFYQNEEKRKFDFSVSEKKKIEIKTTLKPERIHHFLHQQLDTDRYDIKVISIMLQKDDAGTSILELTKMCEEIFSSYFTVVLLCERIAKRISDSDLDNLKFNFQYAKDNIEFYDAKKMPRFKEKDVEGVFNVEYDVDLTNAECEPPIKLINWITER